MTPTLDLACVFSFSALWAAAHRASRGHRGSASVARYRLDLESRLLELRAAVLGGTWRPSPVRVMAIRDPKPRTIAVPPFGDRVVHQVIASVLSPIHERRMIADTYACRPGKGTHAALRRATAWARTWRWWVRLDVVKFFPTIDHELVRGQMARDLPAGAFRTLCETILAAGGVRGAGPHGAGDDLFAPMGRVAGLPLGSLTSQLWANRYLDPVDHLIKDALGHRGYLRYMDDMLLLGDDRTALEAVARRVEGLCHGLRLRLHAWDVQPTRGGVGFVGFRVMPDHLRVRRTSVGRAVRRLGGMLARGQGMHDESFRAGLRAVFAHWRHADSWRLRTATLRRLGLHPDDADRWPETR